MVNKELKIQIPEPNIKRMTIAIKGTAPILFHKWSEKAIRMILDKQMKKATKGREVRDPEKEYENSFYKNKAGNIAIPARNIKQALVGSARFLQGIPMTILRGAIFVVGDNDGLIELKYKKKTMRQDMVVIGLGSADIRFRGMLDGWSAEFIIKYDADLLSAEQVLNLLQRSGFSQ